MQIGIGKLNEWLGQSKSEGKSAGASKLKSSQLYPKRYKACDLQRAFLEMLSPFPQAGFVRYRSRSPMGVQIDPGGSFTGVLNAFQQPDKPDIQQLDIQQLDDPAAFPDSESQGLTSQ